MRIGIREFSESLNKDFMKSVANSYGVKKLASNDLHDILAYVSNIESVYVGNIEKAHILVEELVGEYLDEKKINPLDVEYIIYTKGSYIGKTDINLPYYIQKKLGFKNAIVFSLEQECSSSLLAAYILNALLKKKEGGIGIILTSNFFQTLESRLMGLFVVSDAVGLIEMSNGGEGFEIIDYDSITEGNIMNAQDFIDHAEDVVKIGTKLIQRIICKEGLEINDIFSIIPQNTSLSGWYAYFNTLSIVPEQLFKNNFGGLGHWGDVDFARNITDMREIIAEAPNHSIFLAYALGTGTSVNALLLKKSY